MRPPEPDLTAHMSGFCLRYGAEVIAVFRTFAEAAAALRAARAALQDLKSNAAPAAIETATREG